MTIESQAPGRAIALSIRDLRENDIRRLRLGHWSKLSEEEVRQVVSTYPGRSVWIPESLEYAVVGAWRHRRDVAIVMALSAARHPIQILESVRERSATLGAEAVISIETDEVRRPGFYERAGFRILEDVVTLDFDCRNFVAGNPGRLQFRAASLDLREQCEALNDLDRASFPWLWRNSHEEFLAYSQAPGVELLLGYLGELPICYLGLTAYLGWGHLDRIAVHPRFQGQGFGTEALAFAVARLKHLGAQRVGLSTQRTNIRSQRLYERFGFRRVGDHDYRVYGWTLRDT